MKERTVVITYGSPHTKGLAPFSLKRISIIPDGEGIVNPKLAAWGFLCPLTKVCDGKGVLPMADPKYRPGEKAPKSGQYPVVGPRGGDLDREVTVVEGEPFPPTQKPGQGYGNPDKTKHKK